jgi:hypothetical protein
MTTRFCLALWLTCGFPAVQAVGPPQPAVPRDPVTAILDAFTSHSIVALAEPHGNEQAAALRIGLIRHPRFATTVNDIVVESGNARYQDVIDRFTRGDTIDDATLRKVWQNTTQSHTVWDVPIYEQFFREVRAVNLKLPAAKRLRVLLGDPPVDWDGADRNDVSSAVPPEERTRYPAEVIRHEVIAKNRRALVVYGGMHLRRRNVNNDTIVALLEKAGVRPFTVWTDADGHLEHLEPRTSSWRRPSLARLEGTSLGAVAFDAYLGSGSITIQRGQVVAPNVIPWRQLPMQQQFDAVLYLGPLSAMTESKLSPGLCSDSQYMAMRVARMASLPAPPGEASPVDQLKQYCASVARLR